MIPSSTLTIKWTFPFYKFQHTEEIASFEQFEQRINSYLKQYEYKAIPLLRQGEKCYKIQKPAYKQKIKQKFRNLELAKNVPQVEQSWTSLTSSKIGRRSSFTKKQDILMQFRFKQAYEQTIKIQEHCNQLQKTYKEITEKMEMAQTYQTYLNHLRHIKYENKAQSDNDMVTMKIYFLVSEPLVRMAESKIDNQVKLLPIMRQSIKVHEHMQKIKQYHQRNKSINLKFEKIYITYEKLQELVEKLDRQPEKDVDLIVLQVYTELYQESNQFYVCLEDQYALGLQNRNKTLNSLIQILGRIPKLHCIVLVGPSMRKIKQKQLESKPSANQIKLDFQPSLKKAASNNFRNSTLSKLKKKQWFAEALVPIVVVGVFDAEKDIFFTKIFLQVFYTNLFKRQTVAECSESTGGQFKRASIAVKQNNNILECCCLHGQKNNSHNWRELVEKIGLYTVHKIFSHQNYNDYSAKLSNERFSKEIVKLVLNVENPTTAMSNKNNEIVFDCQNDSSVHRNFRQPSGDFLRYNIKMDTNLLPKREKTIWQTGKLLTEKIQDNRYSRFRPSVLYDLITKMLMKNTLNIIIIKGCSKSGKTQFINLAECYASNRTNRIKFKRFRDWLKIYRQNKSIEAVKQILRDAFEQNQEKSKIIPEKLVLIVGKVYYEVEGEYQNFLAQIIASEEITKYDLVILSALGESQNIHNQKVEKYVTKFDIPSISDAEMKYLILRDEQTYLKKDVEDIQIMRQILKEFTSNVVGETNIRSQIHYSSFCKELRSIIEVIKSKKIETEAEMRKAAREEIKKYVNKTRTALDQIRQKCKEKDKPIMQMQSTQCQSPINRCSQIWSAIGFFCSFREGFFLCDFNKTIALLDQNIFQQITTKKQFYQVRLFRISTNNKQRQSVRQQKSYSIRPQVQCFNYFNEKKKMFRHRKINYFFNFYYLIYQVMSKTKDKFSKLHERIFENYGIFMYDFKEDLQSIINSDEDRKKMLEPEQLQYIISDEGSQDRNFIYNTVVEKHIYIFIEFLKEINEDWIETRAQEQKNLLLIIYSILMAAICHKNLDLVLGSKKIQLNEQIKKFVSLNEQSTQQLVIIMLAQICAVIGHQNLANVENIIKQSQDWIYKAIMRDLANLQLYEINKQKIEAKMKQMNQIVSSQSMKLENKEYELKKLAKQIQNEMVDAVNRIKLSIDEIQLTEQIKARHYQCILNIVLTKILIKFSIFNDQNQQNTSFNSEQLNRSLKQITQNIKRVDQKFVFSNSEIKICFAYLKIKINLLACKDSDIPSSVRYLSEEYLEMYQYVKQKLNPKTLFQSPHIALFMKAGCLKVFQREYNFVRMNNIISKFLKVKLSNKIINLLFLNLSQKNFQMVSEQEPVIDYFVLTVDCIENSNKNLCVVLEDTAMSCKLIDVRQFLDMLKKIKVKFLILSGSHSHKLSQLIQSQPNPDLISIIALTFDKEQLDLSTYPISQSFTLLLETISPIKIVQDFTKAENTQRILEMTICSIVTLLAKKQRDFKPSRDKIDEIVSSAIKVAVDVLISWYKIKIKQLDNIYEIRKDVYVNQNYRGEFPYIPAGEIKNLTSEVIAIPSNFNDDSYYENVGRIEIISQIMKELSSARLKVVEIAGGQRSGKTQILKEVGWFCRTRKIFQSGVYRYDVKYLIQNKQLKTITKDLNKQYPSKQNLLVLFDNLEIEYLQNHPQFFETLFEMLSTKPVSIVYTVSKQPNSAQTENSNSSKNINKLVNQKLYYYLQGYKLYGFRTLDINKLTDVEKICIALINFRNRGKMPYTDILQTYFPQLYNLTIKKSQSLSLITRKASRTQSQGGAEKLRKQKQKKKNKNKSKNPFESFSKRSKSYAQSYEVPYFSKRASAQNELQIKRKQKEREENEKKEEQQQMDQDFFAMDIVQNNASNMQVSQQMIQTSQQMMVSQEVLLISQQIAEDPNQDDYSEQKQSKMSSSVVPVKIPSSSLLLSIPVASKKGDQSPSLSHSSERDQQSSDLAYILELCNEYKIRRTEEQNLNLNSIERWERSQQEIIQPDQVYEQNYLNFDIERMQEKLVEGEHNWIKVEIENRAYCRRYDFWNASMM